MDGILNIDGGVVVVVCVCGELDVRSVLLYER